MVAWYPGPAGAAGGGASHWRWRLHLRPGETRICQGLKEVLKISDSKLWIGSRLLTASFLLLPGGPLDAGGRGGAPRGREAAPQGVPQGRVRCHAG